jgi:hypothetical protein
MHEEVHRRLDIFLPTSHTSFHQNDLISMARGSPPPHHRSSARPRSRERSRSKTRHTHHGKPDEPSRKELFPNRTQKSRESLKHQDEARGRSSDHSPGRGRKRPRDASQSPSRRPEASKHDHRPENRQSESLKKDSDDRHPAREKTEGSKKSSRKRRRHSRRSRSPPRHRSPRNHSPSYRRPESRERYPSKEGPRRSRSASTHSHAYSQRHSRRDSPDPYHHPYPAGPRHYPDSPPHSGYPRQGYYEDWPPDRHWNGRERERFVNPSNPDFFANRTTALRMAMTTMAADHRTITILIIRLIHHIVGTLMTKAHLLDHPFDLHHLKKPNLPNLLQPQNSTSKTSVGPLQKA